MTPFFSIITPTFNRSHFLAQNIKSIQLQKQMGFDHEHVIVDNNSTDDTEGVVRAFMKEDARIKYVRSPQNLGCADALNKGYAVSQGSFIIPLDDDDMLPLSSLQFRYQFLQRTPEVDWCYGHSLFIDETNALWKDLLEFRVVRGEKADVLEDLLDRNFIPNGTVTIRRDCIQNVGGWNKDLALQDYDMWLKLASHGYKLGYLESYLAYYRVHKGQVHKIHQKDGTDKKEQEFFKALYRKKDLV